MGPEQFGMIQNCSEPLNGQGISSYDHYFLSHVSFFEVEGLIFWWLKKVIHMKVLALQ